MGERAVFKDIQKLQEHRNKRIHLSALQGDISLQGAVHNKNPLTPEEVAFTDTPAEKISGGMVKTLAGKSVGSEDFRSVQDMRIRTPMLRTTSVSEALRAAARSSIST